MIDFPLLIQNVEINLKGMKRNKYPSILRISETSALMPSFLAAKLQSNHAEHSIRFFFFPFLF